MKTTIAFYDKDGQLHLIRITAAWGKIKAQSSDESLDIDNLARPFFDGCPKIRIEQSA